MTTTSPAGLHHWKIDHQRPGRSGNRIPDNVREQIVDLDLDAPGAARFIDKKSSFVSEASVYRLSRPD